MEPVSAVSIATFVVRVGGAGPSTANAAAYVCSLSLAACSKCSIKVLWQFDIHPTCVAGDGAGPVKLASDNEMLDEETTPQLPVEATTPRDFADRSDHAPTGNDQGPEKVADNWVEEEEEFEGFGINSWNDSAGYYSEHYYFSEEDD